MTVWMALVAPGVAAAAAVRSTWSPCGLSMLSTITPFGEGAKGHSYRATAGWFVAGATLGGATLGTLMALMALAVQAVHATAATTGLVALAAALIAAGSDSGIAGVRLPVHRRQVNERWLDRYRPWVYGAGFGWQIGTGLCTYITTAAVYLTVVLGALTGRPALALSVGTFFGFLRGMAVLLTRHLADPSELRAFHRRFLEVGPVAGRLVIGVELASAAAMAAWVRSPAVLVVVLLAAAVTVGAVARSVRSAQQMMAVASTCPVPEATAHTVPPAPERSPRVAAQPSLEPREGAVDGTGSSRGWSPAMSPGSLRSPPSSSSPTAPSPTS